MSEKGLEFLGASGSRREPALHQLVCTTGRSYVQRFRGLLSKHLDPYPSNDTRPSLGVSKGGFL